ncbi:hypothetical protein EVE91_09515 [Lactiplantibacillus plantarum]|nr:hypothetical protein EVE91_09515 [Lactiplantibacillus plantarum]RWZ70925.1 hypothetical protein EQH87_09535 [Lactiplantibacillus plantarum]
MKFKQALQQRVLVADGAMGTLLYGNYGINSAFENLNLTHPDTIFTRSPIVHSGWCRYYSNQHLRCEPPKVDPV